VEPPQGPPGPRRNDLDRPEQWRILAGGRNAGISGRQCFSWVTGGIIWQAECRWQVL